MARLREKAKMIVDAEQVHPRGHSYPACLHVKTAAEAEDQTPKEQLGITGRVKQDIDRLQAAVDEKIGEVRAELKGEMVEIKGEVAEMKGEVAEMKAEINAKLDQILAN